MPKAKSGFYAVKQGRVPGVYLTWEECESQVKGVSGASYKKFHTMEDAEAFVGTNASTGNNRGTNRQRSNIQNARPREVEVQAVGLSHEHPVTAQARVPSTLGHGGSNRTDSRGRNSITQKASLDAEDGRTARVVYTDGACSSNGKAGATAGIGVWWGWGDERNLSERCPGMQTNNRAEIYAIVRLLEQAPTTGEKSRLVIKTDSKYTINCVMTWARGWEAKGWMRAPGEEVKNAGMIQYLLALLSLRAAQGELIVFEHVRGHSGDEGNDAADGLARAGTTKPVIPERDWLTEKNRVEEAIQTNIKLSKTLSQSKMQDQFEFVIEEGDLLSFEELEELARSQEF